MFVREWMSAPVVAISSGTSVLDALRVMEMRAVRRLPVLEGEALIGIVTREDLHALLGYGEGRAAEAEAPLDRVMRSPVVTVGLRDTLERAAELMLEKEISGLPVLDEGRLAGIITESDVFRALTRLLGLRESGARVVLSVAEGSDLVEEIRRRSAGLAIRSLSATPRPGGWEVVMRLRGRATAPVSP
jgi:acetoin utilization protein AcuB